MWRGNNWGVLRQAQDERILDSGRPRRVAPTSEELSPGAFQDFPHTIQVDGLGLAAVADGDPITRSASSHLTVRTSLAALPALWLTSSVTRARADE
jgi:hypothetical protein